MQQILTKDGPAALRELLSRFMNEYMPVLSLSSWDVFSVIDGISFMPVDRNVWLTVQCFLNQAQSSFVEIKYAAFFFNHQLVCSTLKLHALRPICRYLFQYPPNRRQIFEENVLGNDTVSLMALTHRNAKIHVRDGEPLHMLVFRVQEVLYSWLSHARCCIDSSPSYVCLIFVLTGTGGCIH